MQSETEIFVAVDDGFRQNKGVDTHGKTLCIASNARIGYTLSSIGEDDDDGGYESEGREYTVDPNIEGEDTRFSDFAHSGLNRVLVHHVLHGLGHSGQTINLVTGLPFSTYFRAGTSQPNVEFIEKKKASLAVPVLPKSGKASVAIGKQMVAAQGVAAWIDCVVDDDGNWRNGNPPGGMEAVIDIGGRTTDIVSIMPGIKIDHECSGTGIVGVSDVVDKLSELLHTELGVSSVRLSTLNNALRSGQIKLRGEQVSIQKLIAKAVAAVADKVARQVKGCIGDGAELDRIYLVGGGATLLAPHLLPLMPHLVVAEDPEFANARGMLKFMRFMG